MKKALITICVLLVLCAIAFPSWKWYEARATNDTIAKEAAKTQEALAVQQSFLATYGQNVKVNSFVTPENLKIYGVSWSDDKYIHTGLNVNGVWVEIARQELPKSAPATP